MKALRRPRIHGSKTPWEVLSGDGFSDRNQGFLLLLDPAGRLIAATPQWHARLARWWRWDEGTAWGNVVPDPEAAVAWTEWTQVVRAALASENPLQTTLSLQRGRGHRLRIECLCQPVHDPEGRGVGVIIAGKFLSARARSTAKPSAAPAGDMPPVDTARSAGDVATLWIRAKRRKGEAGWFVESVSTGARKLFGGENAIKVGFDFPDCLPPELRLPGAELLERSLSTHEPSACCVEAPAQARHRGGWELTLVGASGERWCLVAQRRPAQAAARTLLVACAGQIVTLERELRRAQRLATQGMLAAAIGHEINNCLGIALANAQLFREQHGPQREAVRAIEPVIFAVETAGKICQRFRKLGGRSEALPGIIDLGQTLQRCFELLVRIVARQIVFTPPDGVLLVRADPVHIEQIVVNLVLNARDATRENTGRIELKTGRSAGGAGRGFHWFEVEDDGAGIPVAVQKKLFTAYFTTKSSRGGTGLGLATVLRLTKNMGGDVSLTSGVRRGTRVRVTLPAADTAQAA